MQKLQGMVEIKKDSLRQNQGGEIKLGFTIQHADMPDYLFSDPMGQRYYVVFINADDYEEMEGKTNQVSQPGNKVERPEGEKMRMQAGIYGTDAEFKQFVFEGFFLDGILHQAPNDSQDAIVGFIRQFCGITSRKELVDNTKAQGKFRVLQGKFADWKFERTYAENLGR